MRAPMFLCNIVSLLCCGGLTAQMVWPQGHSSANGGSSKATPFSISSAIAPARTRSVITCAASSLPFSPNQTISGMAFRRDAIHSSVYPGYNATVQVRIRSIADAATLTSAAHWVFFEHHEVFVGSVAIPGASSPSGSGTAPFSLRIPFATPWTYPGGDLAIELSVTGPAGSVWRCDAVALPWNGGGRSTGIGGGCPTSAGDLPPMFVRDLSTVHAGGSIEYVVDRLALPPNGTAMFFAFGNKSPGFGLGAQFDPTCQAYLNPIITSVLGLFGNRHINHVRGEMLISLPNSPGLAGVRLAAQGVFVDFGLSSQLPICVTQGVEVELGARPPAIATFVGRTQWIYGATPLGSIQGLRLGRPNDVPVIEFF